MHDQIRALNQHLHLLFLLPSSVSNQVPFPVYFTGRCCIKGSGDKTNWCRIEFGFSSQQSLKETTCRKASCRRMMCVKLVLVILWTLWEPCRSCVKNWQTSVAHAAVEQCWLWVFTTDKEFLSFLLQGYPRIFFESSFCRLLVYM